MTEEPTPPPAEDASDEPSEAEMHAWLGTPEGSAAMREVMEKTVAGAYGKVPEEMLRLAREGLKRHHSVDVMKVVVQRRAVLGERMNAVLRDGPEGTLSPWEQMRVFHEEVKALVDLVLEVHEPRRSQFMPRLLELQQMIEEVMKTL